MPGLEGFNSAPPDELRPLLTECLAVPRWVDALLAGRPYADVDALLAASDRFADLTDDEVRTAISGHPRIGEKARTGGVSAKWSADEQSGVTASLADRLLAANAAYEDRFGHIYLVCATGLTGERMLADLAARMDNPPAAELRVVSRELAKIAALRLRKVLA
ncbi:2-oxo-4-hydroxy-4-carboxy-5-ureidoimidazoline decarboxylase [Saccharothrix ecbatanensis]|uniref:2-oxo-4-hydroxy-4-carboxy-5-ureidoimidazoline decarboxylase n=1 Tax=Saccharothrix ecbatanensis TaxID=1105145 RepID=A0A7W9HNN4_9PSEU|nr:2-oxo-4-hydroxy-4-carboxy-5-ureidoimidazoline decarboxylase [Saccharothrix ecbatanensis]MBB5805356.1 2-oxo-4-hydroxy-4-carboxy-5-ureidoimidazoline decarboxylase [Saccharothrix ecbatanensis]